VVTNQSLETALAVVDVGQGFRQREDLALASSLAEVLGAQLGCSRPMAADRDWFPEWLGLSGRKVTPRLVVTLGIAGAVQHMVGIREARVIAAVNIDENAGIFSQADVGVVADLYEFVPAWWTRSGRGASPWRTTEQRAARPTDTQGSAG